MTVSPVLLNAWIYFAKTEQDNYFVVVDEKNNEIEDKLKQKFEQHHSNTSDKLNIIDRATLQLLEQLEKSGILNINHDKLNCLHRGTVVEKQQKSEHQKRYQAAQAFLEKAERKLKMATLLGSEEFLSEALAPLKESFNLSLTGLLHWQGHSTINA